jgi:hypothetical protein
MDFESHPCILAQFRLSIMFLAELFIENLSLKIRRWRVARVKAEAPEWL